MSAVNAITGYEYKGVNQATLGTGKWATFNQWRNAGYMVRKGEKATQIMNRIVKDEDTNKVRFTGYSYVFNSEQVDELVVAEVKDTHASDMSAITESNAADLKELQDEQVNNKPAKKVTSKQALRKVASQMSEGYRLMHVTYKGSTWSTDGYSAVNQVLQPTRKHTELQVKPEIDLEKLIPTDLYEAKQVGTADDGKYIMLESVNVSTLRVKVNAKWYTNLVNLYPKAVVKVTDKLSPVTLWEKKKLVAVIMPVKG